MIKPNSQKGVSLTEALVAFAIVSIGLLAVITFQSGLFKNSAHSKARTEALTLAQQKIEQFKHYTKSSEEAYIDDNADGVMDADGNYAENPIAGQNAVFVRSWDLASTDQGKVVDVSVSWDDANGQNQSVMLSADIPWLSPRTAADQVVDLVDPILDAPTGRAKLGEGNLGDLAGTPTKFPNLYPGDGLDMYQYEENLLLTNANGDIVLTLLDACSIDTGACTDFVRIAGTVYLDTAVAGEELSEIEVLASDAAHCQRWVPSGTIGNPPTTPNGDYEFFHYTCYLGGGWHGNIGMILTTNAGLQLTDKVCQGDPTAFDAWEQPVIALRRAYRGMIHRTVGGTTRYYSHGIKDATRIIGQDFVFTKLRAQETQGIHCATVDAAMTRPDSNSGKLFTDVPTDFVCLNHDPNGDGLPDFLDLFDTTMFGANTTCPFDPTSPPVLSHQIRGVVGVLATNAPNFDKFEVLTSDGPGNCQIVSTGSAGDQHRAEYVCTVYDWGLGWNGYVGVRPNSDTIYCPAPVAHFTNLITDARNDFSCTSTSVVHLQGTITYLANNPITALSIETAGSGSFGVCEFNATSYRCVVPYGGSSWSGTLNVVSDGFVCGSTEGAIKLTGLAADSNPHGMNVTITGNTSQCPLEPVPIAL